MGCIGFGGFGGFRGCRGLYSKLWLYRVELLM